MHALIAMIARFADMFNINLTPVFDWEAKRKTHILLEHARVGLCDCTQT